MKKLTGGQKTVLALATIPMIAVGGFGGWGTYTNIVSEFGRAATAAGAVAAGEGVTLVAALVMLVLTMLGQSSPAVVRVFLWLGPLAASAVLVPADAVIRTGTEAVVIVDEGEGRFRPQPVVLGEEADGVGDGLRCVVLERRRLHRCPRSAGRGRFREGTCRRHDGCDGRHPPHAPA